MRHRVARAGEAHRLAVDADHAAVERVGAEDRPRRLGAAGADQPGEPQDLAVVGAKRHVDEFDGVRIARGCGGA